MATTIYVSSTYEDLKEYRSAVFEALRKAGYEVIAMEEYVATDRRPVDKCLADVMEADIYVGLFAFRYGYIPPAEHRNPGSLSITELEFRHAEKQGKPCLTFVVSEDAPWPPKYIDGLKGERINRLREHLLTEKTASFFSSPHQLASLVQAAVTKCLSEKPRHVIEQRRKADEDKDNHDEEDRSPGEPEEERYGSGAVFRDKLKDGSHGPEMVVIPAGTFRMGNFSRDAKQSERPVHTVQIVRPFAIGRYEVTFAEYDQFANSTARELPGDEGWGRGQRPVINVSWNDAVEYARWLSGQTGRSYRLPSEAEWEYAAKSGGEEEKFAGTSSEQQLAEYAWYNANSGGKTQQVGGKKPNGLGLCDLSGNVWEWVGDCWHPTYKGAPNDGSAWKENVGLRVMRGGSWSELPEELRSSTRLKGNSVSRLNEIGFRIAQDIH